MPTYVGVINLSTPIVAQSGDFAIDATGTYAYGIATGARGASNTSYRIDLASGQLTPLMTGVGESIFGLVWAPYGGAARLQSDHPFGYRVVTKFHDDRLCSRPGCHGMPTAAAGGDAGVYAYGAG